MRHASEDFRSPEEFRRIRTLISEITVDDIAHDDPPVSVWDAIATRVAVDSAPHEAAPRSPSVVVLADERSRRRPTWFAAAAAVAVLAGVATFLALRSSPPADRLLAQTSLRQLEPLGTTSATARLVSEHGVAHLVIDATAMPAPPAGDSYELWLIDKKVTDPRSLGIVSGSGDIAVPPSIDPKKYPIVDISLEHNDGDRTHSGHSLMRGVLPLD